MARRARLDLRKRSIAIGEREWPFTVDFRSGSAALDLEGTVYRVRPLRWQEKRMLSRFGPVDEETLKRELVQTTLLEPAQAPAAPDELDALFELGRWLSDPQGSVFVPFDPAAMAAATVELCRFTGMAPGSFDSLDAAEVELMWQAAQKTQSEPEPAGSPQTTRILVVPDAAIVSAFPQAADSFEFQEGIKKPDTSESIATDSVAKGAGRARPVADSASESLSDIFTDTVANTMTGRPSAALQPMPASSKAEPARTKANETRREPSKAQHFRVTTWQRGPMPAANSASAIQSGHAEPHRHATSNYLDASGRNAAGSTAVAFATAPTYEDAPIYETASISKAEPQFSVQAGARSSTATSFDPRASSQRLTQKEEPRLEGIIKAAPSSVAADPEFLVDELAEQLAQAASQLGIDVEC